MPQNKRESLIYTVLMCFTMVLWMSVYNVALQHGELSMAVLRNAWLGFPIAYVFAMICDWFLVSGLAKGFAFRFLVKPGVSGRKYRCGVEKGKKVRPASMGNGRSSARKAVSVQIAFLLCRGQLRSCP